VSVRVIAVVSVVTVFPPASKTATAGWEPNATPAIESLGCVTKASRVAEPAVMVRLELTAEASAPSVAVSVYVPARATLHPAKVAMPATAAFGFNVQARVAPAGVLSASVTPLVFPVTVLPPASCTVTTG
jgi:hypothetical protein